MEESRTEQTRRYLASLQDRDGVPDDLYLALLDHPDTPEAETASTILAFHRGVGNGGLAQAFSNARDDTAILNALVRLGPLAEPIRVVVAEAAALYRSLSKKPDQAEDAWGRYRAALEAAEEEWDALDERYSAVTNPVVPGDDLLEKAVLAYALAHSAAFLTATEAMRQP